MERKENFSLPPHPRVPFAPDRCVAAAIALMTASRVFRARRGRGLRAAAATGAIMLATLSGCSGHDGATAVSPSDPSGYLPSPTVTKALRLPDGGVALSGVGPGDAEIRLLQPSGPAYAATAGADGTWSVRLDRSNVPRMFALEGEASGRVVHADGAVATLPAPAAAAVLARPGFGSLRVDARLGILRIACIDYDGGGGGAVSGATAPHAPVRLLLDEVPVGAGVADDEGRFTLLDMDARRPLSMGPHVLRVETRIGGQTAGVEGRWTFGPPVDPGAAVFKASRVDAAWRIDWRIPGGGVQTTIVFDTPPSETPS